MPDAVGYDVQLDTITSGYDKKTCWVQARGGTVPGAGQGGAADWLHVARAILDSGKRCQLYASADEVDRVAAALGAKGLLLIVYASADEAARLCDRWRLEPGETR